MPKVIQVLSQMGSNAALQKEDAIENLLEAAELSDEITEAISNKDITSLERQLDVCPDIVCIVAPAENDDDDEKGDENDDDKDDSSKETNDSVVGF